MSSSTSESQCSIETNYHPKKNSYYFSFLTKLYRYIIPNYARVLHIGCKDGYLLHVINPAFGCGIDEDEAFIQQARNRNPQYTFHAGLATFVNKGEPFDYVIVSASNLQADDVQKLFESIRPHCSPSTRLVVDWHCYVWEPLLGIARRLGLLASEDFVNRLSTENVTNFLQLAGFEVITSGKGLLSPLYIPGFSWLLNNIVSLLPGVRRMNLLRWMVARKQQVVEQPVDRSVSVVIICRNEQGNIEAAVQRCPVMGSSTELVFAEGHSTDGTLEEIYRVQKLYPEKNIKVVVQTGKGKADAVRAGFEAAQGEILMILDGDLTVMPEELPKFYDALVSRRGDFINGSRLIYGMEPGAMQRANFVANHGFGVLISWIMGQRVTDTLCGTKVLYKKDYERIVKGRPFFGLIDPFGDFDLLFGAARLHSKIVDIPVHYKSRSYGITKIRRWHHGCILLKMTMHALRKCRMYGQ